MHELSLALEILDIAQREAEKAGGKPVRVIRLTVGDLSGVEPSSLSFSFEAVKGEKPLTAGAALEITRVPVRIFCRACGEEKQGGGPSGLLVTCPCCGGFDTDLLAGREFSVTELEVED